ncbi:MAG: hypothetical protein ACE363_00520 [Alphaproteobacteria bacterium]
MDDDLDVLEEDRQTALMAIGRLGQVVGGLPWFSRLGQPLSQDEEAMAQRYLDMLGFPDAVPVMTEDWAEAGVAAENPDFDSEGWEVEEQLRADLSREALTYFDETELGDALAKIADTAGPVVLDAGASAASLWAVEDGSIIDAAAGQAVQACYCAGLVLAAQAVEDHPFALKFRLFEMGRWPIGLSGRTFHIF